MRPINGMAGNFLSFTVKLSSAIIFSFLTIRGCLLIWIGWSIPFTKGNLSSPQGRAVLWTRPLEETAAIEMQGKRSVNTSGRLLSTFPSSLAKFGHSEREKALTRHDATSV
jgi:hypothetical protein